MTPTTRPPHGQVISDVVDGRILVMTVDRAKKRNSFTDSREGIASFIERRDARFVGR
jgi:hypothetical protein